jgi:hypothetical protein
VIQDPARKRGNTIVVARHSELLDQLAVPGQQTNIEPLATQIHSSVQREDGPPRARASVDPVERATEEASFANRFAKGSYVL